MTAEAEIPQQWTRSLKIEDTAKGIRMTVHVWAIDKETAIKEAFTMYLQAEDEAKKQGIALAPVEVTPKK